MSSSYRRCRIYLRGLRRFDGDSFMAVLLPTIVVYMLGWIVFGPIPYLTQLRGPNFPILPTMENLNEP
ncbi:hypothetical protein [Stenotrophomonas sepilia]|uniref:hypothetical protein n=1 Tax=Stenotrophomonas sepilia TaxID=2860290 RepID=UPI002E7A80BF|nr:hypothetical protein [Stenotrophomonas sepilia]